MVKPILRITTRHFAGSLKLGANVLYFLFNSWLAYISQPFFLSCGPGGDEGTRTPGPRLAKAVLSQLSYIPVAIFITGCIDLISVGLSGFEPETFPLSEERSNQLS